MTTATATTATAKAAPSKATQFWAQFKEDLSCWCSTRADLARMQRENAQAFQAAHAND